MLLVASVPLPAAETQQQEHHLILNPKICIYFLLKIIDTALNKLLAKRLSKQKHLNIKRIH